MSTVVCTHGFGSCGVGTLYMGVYTVVYTLYMGPRVRFFPSGEGGGLRWTGYGDKTD